MKTYRFTITMTKTVEFEEDDLECWDAKTPEEAAANEAAWLKGEDDQGDYLAMSLNGIGEIEVEYEPIEGES